MKKSKAVSEVTEPTQMFVTKTVKRGPIESPPDEKEETLLISTFVTDPARVEVGMGMTINLGNYESARIEVKLSIPCYKEEIEEAHALASDWVKTKTLEEAREARDFAANR